MKRPTPVKQLTDGRAMLNIGCGTEMHWGWNNLDFSPYAVLAHHPALATTLHARGILSDGRYEALAGVDPEIIRWDLRRGVPFPDDTFDVVYHSHFLEHVEREAVPSVLRENLRVLKPSGVLRIVVPDLRLLVRRYVEAAEALDAGDETARERHEDAVADLFEQIVRRRPSGTSEQRPPIAAIEGLLRGSAARTGENHRWMYDAHALCRLLEQAGFVDVEPLDATSSKIPGWNEFELDVNADGSVYKPLSLFIEGGKSTSA